MTPDTSQLIDKFALEVFVVAADDLHILHVNEMGERKLGYAPGELKGKSLLMVVTGGNREEWRQQLSALRTDPNLKEAVLSYEARRKDGTTYPADVRIQITQYEGRQAYLGLVQDVTPQQAALDQVRKVLQGAALGYWDWDLEHGHFYVDNRWMEILGLKPGEVTIAPNLLRDLVYEGDRDWMEKALFDSLARDNNVLLEFRCYRGDGSLVWVRNSSAVVKRDPHTGAPLRACGTNQDITVEKQQALEREEFFKFFNMSTDLMMIGTADGQLQRVNAATLQTLGYTEEELKAMSLLAWVHPDDRAVTAAEIENQMRTGLTMNFENRCLRKDGAVIWLSWRATFDRVANMTYASARDITTSKELQIQLRRQQDLYRSLIENTEDVICNYDREFRHTYINPSATRIWHIPQQAFIGKTRRELGFADELCQLWENAMEEVFRSGKPTSRVYEAANRTGMAWVYWNAFPGLIEQGEVKTIFTVARDITHFIHTEEELRKANKLNSVGILAGGIAHDFNNILTGLFGSMELAKLQLPPHHRSRELLEQAETAFQRARHLTTQLLTFAKGGDPVRQTVSVGSFIEDVVQFDMSGSNVKLIFNTSPSLWNAFVDKGQISQVFSNLATNAVQAMPKGGRLHITLENAVLQQGEVSGLARGKYLKAIVRDEGMGIAPAHLDKIFDPYFSTKQQGSGLGLATVYSIVMKHGGHIAVESELGKGATFTLYLPASEGSVALDDMPSLQPQQTEERAFRVLIMDDEPMISELCAEFLGDKGFDVATAIDGSEAIAQYSRALRADMRFDCLVMDLTIPGGMGGTDAMAEILRIDPSARAIVASGYAADPVMANYQSFGFRGWLSKPFRVDELENAIRRVLAQRD